MGRGGGARFQFSGGAVRLQRKVLPVGLPGKGSGGGA